MNPFELRGPEFLAFYVALAAVVFGVLEAWRRLSSPAPTDRPIVRDPYLVAGLRGGAREIARVAAFALLLRGELRRVGFHRVEIGTAGRPGPVDPLERAILGRVDGTTKVGTLLRSPNVLAAAEPHLVALEERGLLPTRAEQGARRVAAVVAGVLLVGVAVTKLGVAVSRGRSNIGFLILLTLLASWALVVWARKAARTRRGEAVLRDLRTLIGPRRARVSDVALASHDPELLLIASVGGIVGPPFAPVRAKSHGSAWGGGCGSVTSCGGSGGGSSCGGGGCGGGCGGCGS